MKKMVLLPIEVPDGIYCWDNETDTICSHFDNEGGHPKCEFFRIDTKWGEQWDRRKPLQCLLLRSWVEA